MAAPTDPDVLLLQAAADPARLAILRQLSAQGPTCACDLSPCCDDLSQPTVSHHLRVLREAGWVTGERRGRWIWYSLRSEAVAHFRDLADEIRPGAARSAGALRPSRSAVPGRLPSEPAWRQW